MRSGNHSGLLAGSRQHPPDKPPDSVRRGIRPGIPESALMVMARQFSSTPAAYVADTNAHRIAVVDSTMRAMNDLRIE